MGRLSDDDLQAIRKEASLAQGRQFLEERFGAPRVSAVAQVMLHKAASADPELLRIAVSVRPHDPLAAYAALGGHYNLEKSED